MDTVSMKSQGVLHSTVAHNRCVHKGSQWTLFTTDLCSAPKPKGYDPWQVAVDMDLLNGDYPFAATALQGKHAFVCGASKGIGEATAKMLAKAGADITVCARNGDALTALCETLGDLGSGRHQALMLDLEDTDVLASAFASAAETLGPVHMLLHNAGGPPGGP